jgi:hypothetical protein
MAVDVLTRIQYSFDEIKEWSYTLTFEIPTVVSQDSRVYLVAPEIRSDKQLFNTSLSLRKAIPTLPNSIVVPGQVGPALPYATNVSGFVDQRTAEQAALQARDSAYNLLATIAQVNASVYPTEIRTYSFP